MGFNTVIAYSAYFKKCSGSIKDLILLARPYQWYKNILIFLPLIFVKQLFNFDALLLTFAGFIALCFVSSGNYVINDIMDSVADRVHPEKRFRPIASERISLIIAIIFAIILFGVGLIVSLNLGKPFFLVILLFLILSQIYTLWLKQEVFADILLIGVFFVLRAASGAYLLQVKVSPWLILCTLFLALFLASGKRYADIELLGAKASVHKKTLLFYTPKITDALLTISTTLLLLSYALYTFLSDFKSLIFTLPFALYPVLRYLFLVFSQPEIGRHPHRALLDLRMVIGILLWVIVTLIGIYLV